MPLLLSGGAQRVLDAAAVERVDGLEFVERDDDRAFPVGGKPSGQLEDFVGQAIDVSGRSNSGKADREMAVGLEAQLRPRAGDDVGEPCSRALPLGLDRGEGLGVSLQKRHVRAVAADGQIHGEGPASSQRAQRAMDERRLAVSARGDEEDLLAAAEVRRQTVELRLAVGERIVGHDFAVNEGIVHERIRYGE